MPTLFPDQYDTLANPDSNTGMSDEGYFHDFQHTDANDSIVAIEHYMGRKGATDLDTLTGQATAAANHITVLLGAVDTLTAQLEITNANLTEAQNTLADAVANISDIIATKLDLSGGTMTGQLVIEYPPLPVVAESFNTAQLVLSNTKAGDNPPQLAFRAMGELGLDLYLDASGLWAISSNGGSSLIIDDRGRLNVSSFEDHTLPGSKLVPGSVSGVQLGTNSVTYDKLAPNSVDASKFTSGTMSAIAAAAGCPIGTIVMFGGWSGSSPPPGWFTCDGTPVNRTAFGTLFAYIGTQFGPGDGVSTFNLPDFRSRSPMGAGSWTGSAWWAPDGLPGLYTGWKGGEWNHVLTENELAHHAHSVADPGHAHGVSQSPHAHGVADPGHGHSVADSGHMHHFGAIITSLNGNQQLNPAGVATATHNYPTTRDTCGIGIYGSGTGIGIYAANANIGIYGAGTGIGIYGAGGNWGHNTVHPCVGVMFIIKAAI